MLAGDADMGEGVRRTEGVPPQNPCKTLESSGPRRGERRLGGRMRNTALTAHAVTEIARREGWRQSQEGG